ncbi:MAG TPA: hypothetical protein EYN00_02750 [Planctomycetes bacterium]|nr:hypothetical protein [Planctomycetota bacterium]
MRKLRRRKIGEILVSEGLLTMEALQDSEIRQRKTGESLIEVLLAEGILSETDIVRCICSHYQLPYIQPSRYKFDPQLLELFEVEFLYGNRILPLGRIGDCAMVTLAEIPPPRRGAKDPGIPGCRGLLLPVDHHRDRVCPQTAFPARPGRHSCHRERTPFPLAGLPPRQRWQRLGLRDLAAIPR